MTDATQMEAGRELDDRVARDVMGLTFCEGFVGTGRRENRQGTISEFCTRCGDPHGYHVGRPVAYSTDIAAAWLVVEKLQERDLHVPPRLARLRRGPRH
jgi:hypothetical protein